MKLLPVWIEVPVKQFMSEPNTWVVGVISINGEAPNLDSSTYADFFLPHNINGFKTDFEYTYDDHCGGINTKLTKEVPEFINERLRSNPKCTGWK